jgi:hypothetical protein
MKFSSNYVPTTFKTRRNIRMRLTALRLMEISTYIIVSFVIYCEVVQTIRIQRQKLNGH